MTSNWNVPVCNSLKIKTKPWSRTWGPWSFQASKPKLTMPGTHNPPISNTKQHRGQVETKKNRKADLFFVFIWFLEIILQPCPRCWVPTWVWLPKPCLSGPVRGHFWNYIQVCFGSGYICCLSAWLLKLHAPVISEKLGLGFGSDSAKQNGSRVRPEIFDHPSNWEPQVYKIILGE